MMSSKSDNQEMEKECDDIVFLIFSIALGAGITIAFLAVIFVLFTYIIFVNA